MTSLKVYSIIGIIQVALSFGATMAQESENVFTKQLWLDYNAKVNLDQRLTYNGSYGYRTVSPNTWARLWARNYLTLDWERFILRKARIKEQLVGGVDFYYTMNKNDVNRLEITPFQAISLWMPNRDKLVIRHFIKLEERFELETKDWHNTFGLRLSYQASVTFRFHGRIWSHGNGFYMPLSAQFFWNLIGTEQFNDKIRITPGLGYQISPDLSVAFLVGYNYTRTAIENEFHNNDLIYRFRVYQTIGRQEGNE